MLRGVVGTLVLLLGGFVGGHFGMRAVFFATSVLMAAGATLNWYMMPRTGRPGRNAV